MLIRYGQLMAAVLIGLATTQTYGQQAITDANSGPATSPPSKSDTPEGNDRFAVHGQATFVEQLDDRFHAPYSGPNSLTPGRGAETFDATLFLGARLWQGAEAWINPEIDQGFGLDATLGVAAFPSGTAYKVGRSHPYWRLSRLFIRQSIGLDGPTESVDADENQFAGQQTSNRWVFTIGKFGVPDIFDANDFAHDPRRDFLNWVSIDAGTFDYAAEAWGYTVGGAVERYQGPWTLRAGFFDLSDVPNSEVLDHGFHEFEVVGELERRFEFSQMPGKILVTAFDNYGRMALLDQAITQADVSGANINDVLVGARQYRERTGISASIQQRVTPELGVFARAGVASGNVEIYEFTEADQSLSAGVSLQGMRWNRKQDTVGLVAIQDRISGERERFLNAGGLGLLIGDGQLPRPRPEQVLEGYYEYVPCSWSQVTLDYQYVVNPGYNSDRGPVSLLALRIHGQF